MSVLTTTQESTGAAYAFPAMLEIRGLSLSIDTPAGRADILQDVNMTLERGVTLGIVGEIGLGQVDADEVDPRARAAQRRGSPATVRFDGVDLGPR